MFVTTSLLLAISLYDFTSAAAVTRGDGSCDDVNAGYQCQPEKSHLWGQYSPYFSVPSEISTATPKGCRIDFVNILSRHGARFPTASKSATYSKLIDKVHKATSYGPGFEFLKTYQYTLGSETLTDFGRQELINSGIKYYNRYKGLTTHFDPFVRAASEQRVVESAQKFAEGYHAARLADTTSTAKDDFPYPVVVISEDSGSNNTLNHGLCNNFENNPTYNTLGSSAQKKFNAGWVPAVTSRLNANLPGAGLTDADTISLMDLCPFDTVADPNGVVSPICGIFGIQDFVNYDYYQSLGKYYAYGGGNPLGPTNGVGFTNELLARLTGKPVVDHTSVNQTLDSSRSTFPIGGGKVLFADFSHDNDITGILFALGLYNTTAPLDQTTVQTTAQTNGYSAAYTVPFAARAYFERMVCTGNDEYVRILVNDRVIPLSFCGSDSDGKCKLDAFVKSQTFAQQGGNWDKCFN